MKVQAASPQVQPEAAQCGEEVKRSAAAAPPAVNYDTAKTAVKVAATVVDQFEKYASGSKELLNVAGKAVPLQNLAGPAHGVVKGLKVLNAGITAAQQYQNSVSTSQTGRAVEAAAAGAAAFVVGSNPVTSAVDLASGGMISKTMVASTSMTVGLADAIATGETAGLERFMERSRRGELGAPARGFVALGDASTAIGDHVAAHGVVGTAAAAAGKAGQEARESASYWEKRGLKGGIEDALKALRDD